MVYPSPLPPNDRIEDVDYVLFGMVPLTYGTTLQPARVPSLYRHVLYAPNASLAFTGTLISFTPFVVANLTST